MTAATMTIGSAGSPPLCPWDAVSEAANLVGLVPAFSWAFVPTAVRLVVVLVVAERGRCGSGRPLEIGRRCDCMCTAPALCGDTVPVAAAVAGWVVGAMVGAVLGS